MREEELFDLLLVRAAEETDPDARWLGKRARDTAGRKALESHAEGGEGYLLARAAALSGELEREAPAYRSRAAWLRWLPPTSLLLAGAAVAGFAADELGGERHINLLAFPLLSLLAWNLLMMSADLLRGDRPGGALRLASWWLRRGLRRGLETLTGAAGLPGRALDRFADLWLAATTPLQTARLRWRLHLAAAALALGVVISMYAAGFAFEYRASWESTFLDAAGVQRLLAVVLGPASWLLSDPVPSIAAIGELRRPGEGPAAGWIHRWALTALLGIGLPRLALASVHARRARQLAADLPLDLTARYFARLLAATRGGGDRARILPYSVALSGESDSRLLELLYELLGNRASIERGTPLHYGDDPPPAREGETQIVIFNLAQSPEQEVHGEFLRSCRAAVESGTSRGLLVLLDEERYRSSSSEQRVEERRRSWSRVLRDHGLGAAPLCADAGERLDAARQVLLAGDSP